MHPVSDAVLGPAQRCAPHTQCDESRLEQASVGTAHTVCSQTSVQPTVRDMFYLVAQGTGTHAMVSSFS